MKIVSTPIDEEAYRLSCDRAARLGTSAPALARDYPGSFVRDAGDGGDPTEETEAARRRRLPVEVLAGFEARGVGLRDAVDNLPRDATR